MSSEFGVSCSENSEKSLEKVIGGWVGLKGHRGVQRYPVWYVSGIGQAQKRGQDTSLGLQRTTIPGCQSGYQIQSLCGIGEIKLGEVFTSWLGSQRQWKGAVIPARSEGGHWRRLVEWGHWYPLALKLQRWFPLLDSGWRSQQFNL